MDEKRKMRLLCLAACLALVIACIAWGAGTGKLDLKIGSNKNGSVNEPLNKEETGFGAGGQKGENGKEKDDLEDAVARKAQELLPKKPVTVGFAQAGHGSDWLLAQTKRCKEAFRDENGYRLYFIDADNDHKAQVDAVRGFIKDKVDYILLNPVVESGWTAALKEAYHAKIPVFLLGGRVDCDGKYYEAWFGPDYELEGECAGIWLKSHLDRKRQSDAPLRIAVIFGTMGSSPQLLRMQGFLDYFGQNESWRLISGESGGFTERGGRLAMEKYLDAYLNLDSDKNLELDVLICQNESMAYGAMAALDEAGVAYGKEGGMTILSFDGTKDGLEAVEQGKIQADFGCASDFDLAVLAREAIEELESGGMILKKENYMETACFTCEEEPKYLFTSAGLKRMEIVTAELLKNREY